MRRNEFRPLTLFNSDIKNLKVDMDLKDLNFDHSHNKKSPEYLKPTPLEPEGQFKEVERNYKKAQKDYYIEFMIKGIKKVAKQVKKKTGETQKISKRGIYGKGITCLYYTICVDNELYH